MYPPELVAPMEKDLTEYGFQGLNNKASVVEALEKKGTTLLVINSVCGCAAANARPAVKLSITHIKRPNQCVTVFAGVDREAVDTAREYLLPYPPSSPCIALFKDGKVVHILERMHIEGRSADMIAANLKQAYEQFC